MVYVIDLPAQPAVPVAARTGLFPVRRIWCVGRNYAEHAREMGHDPDREPPFFFSKPADAVVPLGGELSFPAQTVDLHHEVELVVAIGQAGRDIPPEAALSYVYGYAVGFDMTRRDLQAEAKAKGRPWDLAKGFDRSCPISALAPAASVGHPSRGRIEASVNGDLRQSSDLSQMIWSVPEAIAYLSHYVELAPGDLLMTGTPAGVGRVEPGDTLRGVIEGVGAIDLSYVGS